MASTVASRKGKGRRFQQWVESMVGWITKFPYGKDKPIESRPMGQAGTDIRLDAEVKKIFPASIEAKNQERWSIPEWIEQAKKNKEKGTDWFLFVKRNRVDPVVIMDAKVFCNLYKELIDIRRNGIWEKDSMSSTKQSQEKEKETKVRKRKK